MDEKGTAQVNRLNRLIPPMREAVLMVRMLLHGRLMASLATRRPEMPRKAQLWLAGAVGNNLFGTEPENGEITSFARQERALVEEELRGLKDHVPALLPLLADALRMQAICDSQESRETNTNINTTATLLMAKALGILDEERPMPMPSSFMLAVRTLAVSEGLVQDMNPQEEEEPPLRPGPQEK